MIQTRGSRNIDGDIECRGGFNHVWYVEGEFDDPKEGQLCQCGQQKYSPKPETK